ncbi:MULTISPECIES: holo-ACP synthase [unclassified Halanaerobium]|uniref:holo-ACP synthase n=1 Tax=unclassified Halanaerobium TaxID=2641197 RepID=UPI000DF45FA9|nr:MULTISPECIES: holo-ACP synthase [unclassified Halanaerobium]RCW49273.1 holo-[acyl-carrier-protein] synthase [Halanaerobium sp. MA284_MarDTE_T2]RCW84012.1 holo-[acyl-carrier-protein] synthase [Halanaerobium sp. DL-01]
MIIGTGVDIVENQRIEKLIKKYGDRFIEKLFLLSEADYCKDKAQYVSCFAARYAAKEAALKALGTGLRDNSWHDIEIFHSELGKPEINLKGNAAEIAAKMGVKKIFVTISHEQNYSIAQVILEGED